MSKCFEHVRIWPRSILIASNESMFLAKWTNCDFICENMPYGGTNSVFFRTFVIVFMDNTAQRETIMFSVDAHERHTS